MDIVLKNIRVPRAAGIGTAYSAALWVDGRCVGHVGNHGRGEPDYQHIDRGTLAGVNAWLANNTSPLDPGLDYHDLESWCAEQVARRDLAA